MAASDQSVVGEAVLCVRAAIFDDLGVEVSLFPFLKRAIDPHATAQGVGVGRAIETFNKVVGTLVAQILALSAFSVARDIFDILWKSHASAIIAAFEVENHYV